MKVQTEGELNARSPARVLMCRFDRSGWSDISTPAKDFCKQLLNKCASLAPLLPGLGATAAVHVRMCWHVCGVSVVLVVCATSVLHALVSGRHVIVRARSLAA
jgi:hypothetical protein